MAPQRPTSAARDFADADDVPARQACNSPPSIRPRSHQKIIGRVPSDVPVASRLSNAISFRNSAASAPFMEGQPPSSPPSVENGGIQTGFRPQTASARPPRARDVSSS